ETVGGVNLANVALWNDMIVSDLVSGNLGLSKVEFSPETKSMSSRQIASVDIPVGSMSRVYTANVSDNMQWLAVSSKTRGAMWNLDTGERKLHVRGFRG